MDTDLVADAALLALVVDPSEEVYPVPFAPIVGKGTLPETSHSPLVNAGHAGGVSVGV